jgi:diacylglycerol kinase (ATP)
VKLVERVLATLRAAGHGVTAFPTGGPDSAGALARERIAAGADLILALGGDGTMNELLPGVVHSGVPICALPAGTANVLARELGVGTKALHAAARLGELVPRRVSIGLLRTAGSRCRYFLLMAGVGFDAHIVYRLNLGLKSRMGELAYWTAACGELGRKLDEFEVEVDGKTYVCTFALVSRVRNYGGYLEIAQDVSLLDHQFEAVLFQGTSTLLDYGKYLVAILSGKASNVQGVTFLPAERISFAAPGESRVYVQVDGEYAGRLPAAIEIVREAVTLLVPPGYPNRASSS